jgi:hypothetical protein
MHNWRAMPARHSCDAEPGLSLRGGAGVPGREPLRSREPLPSQLGRTQRAVIHHHRDAAHHNPISGVLSPHSACGARGRAECRWSRHGSNASGVEAGRAPGPYGADRHLAIRHKQIRRNILTATEVGLEKLLGQERGRLVRTLHVLRRYANNKNRRRVMHTSNWHGSCSAKRHGRSHRRTDV